MPAGTTLPEVKQLIVDRLTARLGATANVSYTPPVVTEDFYADSGEPSAVWLGITTNYSVVPNVLTAGVVWLDETYDLPVVVQALLDGSEAENDTDRRAAELLHGVWGAFAQQPGVGFIDTAELQVFTVLPTAATHVARRPGGNALAYGSRFELTITVRARLKLT